MKVFILCVCLLVVCLGLASANGDSSRKVGTIHSRITAVPSDGRSRSTASENRPVPSIDRTIAYLYRSRRSADYVAPTNERSQVKATTEYPKHHLLQPNRVSVGEFQPTEDLDSSTAPYTENHHSWKKSTFFV